MRLLSGLAARGLDPLPTYTPPYEDPLTRPEMAARFPLQMVSPPSPSFLNSTFVNVDALRKMAGEPSVDIHSEDALARRIRDGDWVRVFNDRGAFRARARVGGTVKPGVVVAQGVWWNRFTPDGVNCNTTTSSRLTDLGGGATFFDNLVEVAIDASKHRNVIHSRLSECLLLIQVALRTLARRSHNLVSSK